AAVLGIPVFTHIEDAQRGRWRMAPDLPLVDPRRPAAGLPEPPPWRRQEIVARSARPTHHQARQRRIRVEEASRRPLPFWLQLTGYMAMGSAVAVMLVFFTLYVLPAATITITPGREPIQVTVMLTADGNADTVDPDLNVLPARFIETTIEETGAIATTGTRQEASSHATGYVVFNNLGSSPVDIPAGTIVSTSTGTPVSFRTTSPAQVAGGVGARVTVPVEALEPGIEGNVRANTINTVSGALRFRVRVSNPGATGGGGAELVPVVTQQDKDNLLAQLQERIQAKAYEALLSEVHEGEWLPPESVQTFTVAQVFDKFNDDKATELSLTLRVLAQGTVLNQAQTNEAMMAALRRAVPERGMLVADTVTFQRAPGAVALERRVQFTMTASADYVIPIDPAEVKSTIAGLTSEEAVRAVMARWPLARPPEIYRDPEWLATLPNFGSRIQVRIEYAGSLETP
ncbi:MAG TPA: baseplate J/gp47 family protein, partial [Caldilineaceae bacterium]|nr:baseplate J/gp47 family protein [Caldilineaceae bacterium]